MPHIGPYYMNKPGYKQVGEWGFDRLRLWNKIDKEPDENGCLNWNGAMSPTGALMGAWKSHNGEIRQQMTQVRRLVMMDATNTDMSEYQIKLTCGNQSCCNKEHFVLMPSNRPKPKEELAKKPTKSKTTKPKTKQISKAWWLV